MRGEGVVRTDFDPIRNHKRPGEVDERFIEVFGICGALTNRDFDTFVRLRHCYLWLNKRVVKLQRAIVLLDLWKIAMFVFCCFKQQRFNNKRLKIKIFGLPK